MEHYKNLSLHDLWEVIDGILYVECWKTIENFPDYKISSFGRVKTYKRGGVALRKSRLSPKGYPELPLYNKSGRSIILVHRLVAETFLPNPENKRTVNHKNGIRLDNAIVNLEWATYSENIKHSFSKLNRIKTTPGKGKFGKDSNVSKAVVCVSNGKIYETVYEAASDNGISKSRMSALCCDSNKKSRTGLIFKFI